MPSTLDPEPSKYEALFDSPYKMPSDHETPPAYLTPSAFLSDSEPSKHESLLDSPSKIPSDYLTPSAFLSDPEPVEDEDLSNSPVPEFSIDENTLPEPNLDVTKFFLENGGKPISTLPGMTPQIDFRISNVPPTQELLDNIGRDSETVRAKIIPREKPLRKKKGKQSKEDPLGIIFDLRDAANRVKAKQSRLKTLEELSPKLQRIASRQLKRYLEEEQTRRMMEKEKKRKEREEAERRLNERLQEQAKDEAIKQSMNNSRTRTMHQNGLFCGTKLQPQPPPQIPQSQIPFQPQQPLPPQPLQVPFQSQPQIPLQEFNIYQQPPSWTQSQIPGPIDMHQQGNPSMYPPAPPIPDTFAGNVANGPDGLPDWTSQVDEPDGIPPATMNSHLKPPE